MPDPARRRWGARIAFLTVLSSGVIAQVLGFLIVIFTTRMLGVHGRGQLALMLALAAMASQLTFGSAMANAVTKALAERQITAADGLRHLVRWWVLAGFVISAVFAAYYLAINRDDLSRTTLALAASVLFYAVLTMTQRMMVGALLGEDASVIHIALAGLSAPSLLAGILAVLFFTRVPVDVVGVAAATVFSAVVAVIVTRLMFARGTAGDADRIEGKELNRVARQFFIGSVGPIDGLMIDRILVGSILGNVALGLFSAATALSGLVAVLGSVLAMIVLPRIAAVHAVDQEHARRLGRKWLVVTAGLLATVVVVTELIIPMAIPVIFGSDFAAAVRCAQILVPAYALLGYRRLQIALLQARDRGGVASKVELFVTILMIGGVVFATSTGDIEAVALVALGAGMLACTLLGLALARPSPSSAESGAPLGAP